MFLFYFVEKVVRGISELDIWQVEYHRAGWQNVFDCFHSFPLIGLGMAIAYRFQSRLGLLFFSSMVLHSLGDLPLHHDDAHRHFFPLSNWQFVSPISYWDSRHYGEIAGQLEALMVVVGCGILFRVYRLQISRLVLGMVGGSYLVYFAYALAIWG
jgi:hypothetical protein